MSEEFGSTEALPAGNPCDHPGALLEAVCRALRDSEPGMEQKSWLYWLPSARAAAQVVREACAKRVDDLEARLEMDHMFELAADGETMVRVEIPPEERSFSADGIECRDATIRLQDECIKRSQARTAKLEEALAAETERCAIVADDHSENWACKACASSESGYQDCGTVIAERIRAVLSQGDRTAEDHTEAGA